MKKARILEAYVAICDEITETERDLGTLRARQAGEVADRAELARLALIEQAKVDILVPLRAAEKALWPLL